MAKVMVSLPDDLLAAVDRQAAQQGKTRSGLLREFADQAMRRRSELRGARIDAIMGDGVAHDGRAVEHLRADRDR